MSTKTFVNLPVIDLKNSMRFYEALGYKHNPQFTDETAASIVKKIEFLPHLQSTYNSKQPTKGTEDENA